MTLPLRCYCKAIRIQESRLVCKMNWRVPFTEATSVQTFDVQASESNGTALTN